MNKFIPSRIAALEEYTPSEGTYSVRLDANENPYPLDAPDALVMLNRYPDSSARALREAFCGVYGCPPECVVAGNGSDELISVIVNALLSDGDTLAVTLPDFSMYSFYASLAGCNIVTDVKSGDGGIDFDGLSALISQSCAKMVMFSNPCNPTGRAYSRDIILDFVKSAGCLCVVDEAYMEFCSPSRSVLDMCGKLDNLIVLKTLSKAYGAAGARIGFAVCPREIAGALMKVKSPYNLNSASQALGVYLLGKYPGGRQTGDIIRDSQALYTSLSALEDKGGYRALPTDANFVLLSFGKPGRAAIIYEELKAGGILIRCPDALHLRISCGTPEENKAFLTAFSAALDSLI